MINFTPYDGDSFNLYKVAVDRKRNVADKLKLQNIEEKVKNSYDNYQAAFNGKSVHSLNKDDSYSLDEKDLLKGLYGSSNRVVRDIRASGQTH